MADVPEFAIRITSTEDGHEAWDIMQRCIGVDYYVTLATVDTLDEAREAIADIKAT